MKYYNFYQEFIKSLSEDRFIPSSTSPNNCVHSSILHLFELNIKMIGEKTFNEWLNYHHEQYKDSPFEEYFHDLHKSLRQRDVSCSYIVRSITKEDAHEINKNKNIHEEVIKVPGWHQYYIIDRNSGGIIDSMLWNLIHCSNAFEYVLRHIFSDINDGFLIPM